MRCYLVYLSEKQDAAMMDLDENVYCNPKRKHAKWTVTI